MNANQIKAFEALADATTPNPTYVLVKELAYSDGHEGYIHRRFFWVGPDEGYSVMPHLALRYNNDQLTAPVAEIKRFYAEDWTPSVQNPNPKITVHWCQVYPVAVSQQWINHVSSGPEGWRSIEA